jgi:hypothetical protein
MPEYLLLNNEMKTELGKLFEEKKAQPRRGISEDIFENPSVLVAKCGLSNVLDSSPFKYIRTAGTVWEFYLLRYANEFSDGKHSKKKYNKLIKPLGRNENPLPGCSRRKVGNPYNIWLRNYPLIENKELQRRTQSFANKLVSRKCPIRKLKNSHDFMDKRKNAANAFFRFLVKQNITIKMFKELVDHEEAGFQCRMAQLLHKYPSNPIFITTGVMTALYGGKNTQWIDARLGKAVCKALRNHKGGDEQLIKKICQMLDRKDGKDFRPPYASIYDVKGGNRERVNVNFRTQTWLKLLEETLNAGK